MHLLGPILSRAGSEQPRVARGLALVVLAASGVLLGVAVGLAPSERGMGTHMQLGFPPCTFVTMTGYPCPGCGMTTAFAYTVRGRLLAAFLAQPVGLILALGTVATAGISLCVLITGKVWKVNWYRVRPRAIAVALFGLLLSGWAFKIIAGMISGEFPVGR